jgi:hypothetical protein
VSLEDIAYTAGFFDGEGSIGIVKSRRRKNNGEEYFYLFPRLTIANTDKDVLCWITKTLKTGGYIAVKTPIKVTQKNPRWKKCYRLTITNMDNIESLLKVLIPYLKTNQKAKQAQLLLKFIELRKKRKALILRDRKTGKIVGNLGKPSVDEELFIYEQIRRMNEKNHLKEAVSTWA